MGACRDVGMCCDYDCPDNCSIVEYSTRDEAQRAISKLSNTSFMGRQIFVREVIVDFLLTQAN